MTDQAPAGYLEIAHGQHAVLLQVVGLGNMHNAASLTDYIDSELNNGLLNFVIDLARCTGMDSTFMGTLTGLVARVGEQNGALCLVNVNTDHEKLMKMIGIWELMCIYGDLNTESLETAKLMPDMNPERRLLQIRHAHEILVAIDERNRERFGFFLESIENEIAGQQADSDTDTADPDPEEFRHKRPAPNKRDSEIMRQNILRNSGKQLPRTFDELFYGDLDD